MKKHNIEDVLRDEVGVYALIKTFIELDSKKSSFHKDYILNNINYHHSINTGVMYSAEETFEEVIKNIKIEAMLTYSYDSIYDIENVHNLEIGNGTQHDIFQSAVILHHSTDPEVILSHLFRMKVSGSKRDKKKTNKNNTWMIPDTFSFDADRLFAKISLGDNREILIKPINTSSFRKFESHIIYFDGHSSFTINPYGNLIGVDLVQTYMDKSPLDNKLTTYYSPYVPNTLSVDDRAILKEPFKKLDLFLEVFSKRGIVLTDLKNGESFLEKKHSQIIPFVLETELASREESLPTNKVNDILIKIKENISTSKKRIIVCYKNNRDIKEWYLYDNKFKQIMYYIKSTDSKVTTLLIKKGHCEEYIGKIGDVELSYEEYNYVSQVGSRILTLDNAKVDFVSNGKFLFGKIIKQSNFLKINTSYNIDMIESYMSLIIPSGSEEFVYRTFTRPILSKVHMNLDANTVKKLSYIYAIKSREQLVIDMESSSRKSDSSFSGYVYHKFETATKWRSLTLREHTFSQQIAMRLNEVIFSNFKQKHQPHLEMSDEEILEFVLQIEKYSKSRAEFLNEKLYNVMDVSWYEKGIYSPVYKLNYLLDKEYKHIFSTYRQSFDDISVKELSEYERMMLYAKNLRNRKED